MHSRKKERLTTEISLDEVFPELELSFSPNEDELPLDRLKRSGFSQAIFKLLKNINDKKCAVIGIEGTWGSGKSYVLKQIYQLYENENDPSIQWMVFNPWNFESQQHLISIYLNELAKFIDSLEKKPTWKRVINSFGNYMAKVEKILRFLAKTYPLISAVIIILLAVFSYVYDLASSFGAIGFSVAAIGTFKLFIDSLKEFPTYLEKIADSIRAYAELTKAPDTSSKQDLNKLKKDIREKLIETKVFRKIIVCIEDIDRLTPEEVRTVMQLVRGVADFPRIVYLLGYDRDHVVNSLEQSSPVSSRGEKKGYGEGYLQKIVDAPYALPMPDQNDLTNLMLDKWDINAKRFYGENYKESSYWNQNFGYLYNILTDNLRDFERVCNRATLMLLLLGRRSNPLDVLFCSYLQEFEPNAWKWFKFNGIASLSHGPNWFDVSNNHPVEFNEARLGRLMSQVNNSEKRQQIKDLIKAIIPNYGYGRTQLTSKDRSLYRFADADVMSFYLKYEIGSIAEVEDLMNSIINEDKTRERHISTIISRGDDDTFVLLRNLRERFEEKLISLEHGEQIFIILGQYLDNDRRAANFFGRSFTHEIYWMFVEWLNRVEESQRATIFVRIISKWLSLEAMYLPIELIAKVGKETGWIKLHPNQKLSSKPLEVKLEKAQIKSLTRVLESSISRWNQTNPPKWFEHGYGTSMLFTWLEIDRISARNVLTDWAKDNYKLMWLLNSMIFPAYRNGEEYEHISPHGLSNLTGLSREEILDRVHAVSSDVYLSEKFKKVIALAPNLPNPLPASASEPQFD